MGYTMKQTLDRNCDYSGIVGDHQLEFLPSKTFRQHCRQATELACCCFAALVCLAVASIGSPALATEQKPITNGDVVELTKSRIGDSIIVGTIEHGPTNFDLSPAALVKLKQAGVSDAVIQAMVDSSSTSPGSTSVGGLVDHYTFDHGANDSSGNGNNLSIYGAVPAANQFGKSGTAYSFNGFDNYLQEDGASGLPMGSSARSVNLFFKVNTGGNVIYWGREQAGNGSSFAVGVATNRVWFDNFFDNAELPMSLDQNWHMLTVTYGQGSLSEDVYVDGISIGNAKLAQPLNTQAGILRIGARIDSQGRIQNPFGGVIGEVRIYDRVLSAAEVRRLAGPRTAKQH
jgi:hypothetical protein